MEITAGPSTDDAYLADELAAARERGDHATVARIEHGFAVSRQVNPTNEPLGSPAWQRAKEHGAAINEPGRKQRVQQLKRARARTADPTARMVLAAHVQDTQHQLAQDRALLRGVAPASLPAGRPRVARPRGAGRPRARATARASGDSGDSGSSEGDGEPAAARRHLHLVADLPARPARYTFACLTAEERGA